MLMPFNQLISVLTSCSTYPLHGFGGTFRCAATHLAQSAPFVAQQPISPEVPILLRSNPSRPKCPFRCAATQLARSAHFVAQQPISPEVPISLRSNPFRPKCPFRCEATHFVLDTKATSECFRSIKGETPDAQIPQAIGSL